MEFDPQQHAQLMLIVLRRLMEERERPQVLRHPPIMVVDEQQGVTTVSYTDTVTFLNPAEVQVPG